MKKLGLFIFFVALTSLSCRYFFHAGVPVTHDGNNHLVRFANYKIAVREWQIPPRLAPNLVNKYGYPVFNYNYPLANILSLPFSILNFSYEFTFKALMSLSVFAAFVGAYFFLKNFDLSKKGKIFSLLVFALNPYIVSSVLFRGNIGEVMAWALLPWILYFMEELKKNRKILEKNFFYLIIFLSALFLAHNITAFFACMLLFFYAFFSFAKHFSIWKKFLIAFAWSFLMALWFWLPAITEKNLTILDNVDLSLNYYKQFPTLRQLLNIPIQFGYSYQGNVDSMSFGLGAAQIVLIFLSLIYFLRRKTKNYLIFFIALLVLFLGQLSLSQFLYKIIPFASFIQFPWRLALLLSVVLLPIAALIFEQSKFQGKWLLSIILICQLFQFLQLKPIDYRHKTDIDYDNDGGITSVNQENMPKTFTFEYFGERPAPVFILDGQGQVSVIDFFGSYRDYSLDLQTASTIVESTAFFPGWETTVNGQKISYIDDKTIGGRIAYRLDAGHYQVKTRFTQKTPARIIGNFISVLSCLSFCGLLVYLWQRDKKHNKR